MSSESGTGEKALFFVLGAFVGAATALLLAPRSGEETRKYLASKARVATSQTRPVHTSERARGSSSSSVTRWQLPLRQANKLTRKKRKRRKAR
jgi:gas vesicle protein